MDDTFSSNLRELRKSKGFSQEQIADKFGLSVQAVSKWECAQSYPDIELLPVLADLFGVTVDVLLRGAAGLSGAQSAGQQGNVRGNVKAAGDCENCGMELDLPDDNVLRIIQCIGKKILCEDSYDPNVRIPLSLDQVPFMDQRHLQIEIWGSADIQGNISGDVDAGGTVNCGDVSGDVDAGGTVNCGDVNGDVDAGDSVNCGDVNGDVDAGDNITCGNIDGNATAGDNIECNDIIGNVSCDEDLHCRSIQGSVVCDGDIYSEKQ